MRCPETIEASLQLSEAVLVDIGIPMGLVIASIHERRDEFRAILKSSNPNRTGRAESGTPSVGKPAGDDGRETRGHEVRGEPLDQLPACRTMAHRANSGPVPRG